MIGSIVLHMYTSEKADRVIWQVTDTMGVPILSVLMDSLKSTDYIHSLETTNISLQSTKN